MCTYLTFCHSHSYIKLDTNWGEGKGNRAYVFIIFCLKLLRRTLFLTYNASLFVVYYTGADHFWLDRFEVWAFWRDSRSCSNFDICQVLGWLFKILLPINFGFDPTLLNRAAEDWGLKNCHFLGFKISLL